MLVMHVPLAYAAIAVGGQVCLLRTERDEAFLSKLLVRAQQAWQTDIIPKMEAIFDVCELIKPEDEIAYEDQNTDPILSAGLATSVASL